MYFNEEKSRLIYDLIDTTMPLETGRGGLVPHILLFVLVGTIKVHEVNQLAAAILWWGSGLIDCICYRVEYLQYLQARANRR